MSDAHHPRNWMQTRPEGLYCAAGDFYVDPVRPVARAVITHGHADHYRPGNDAVIATPETLAIANARYGERAGNRLQGLPYGEAVEIGDATLRFAPAGHVLGSAQAVIEHKGARIVISGDYKRRRDPTCQLFEPVSCDVFVTEATFGLPVFRHPDDADEIQKLFASVRRFPDRCHAIGVYNLGKCQRVIGLIREAGYDKPLYLHGGLQALCDLYVSLGVDLGELVPVGDTDKKELAGEIVLAPPSALADRWSRRLPDPVVTMASGWMGVRQRAKQRGAELPLIISDHADWDELTQTLEDVGAPEVWVTHGNEDALVHHAIGRGFDAKALSLLGYDMEEA